MPTSVSGGKTRFPGENFTKSVETDAEKRKTALRLRRLDFDAVGDEDLALAAAGERAAHHAAFFQRNVRNAVIRPERLPGEVVSFIVPLPSFSPLVFNTTIIVVYCCDKKQNDVLLTLG